MRRMQNRKTTSAQPDQPQLDAPHGTSSAPGIGTPPPLGSSAAPAAGGPAGVGVKKKKGKKKK